MGAALLLCKLTCSSTAGTPKFTLSLVEIERACVEVEASMCVKRSVAEDAVDNGGNVVCSVVRGIEAMVSEMSSLRKCVSSANCDERRAASEAS